MNVETGKLEPGEARHPAISAREIIARDRVKAPDWYTSEHYAYLGNEDIDGRRYISSEWQMEEFKRLWTRTWQFACREEHIQGVGDYHVYDVGPYSFIITRVSPTEVRAYFNACLHRGTKLRASGSEGNATQFKCSFHGWSWNVDGTSKDVPCAWDFPHVDRDRLNLPEARVELLGGFVWINPDPDAPSLAEYLGPDAMAHFRRWKLEDRYVVTHVSKPLPANWKLVVNAFAEAYHVPDTHPQVSPTNADLNSQYDVYGEHVSRFISPLGVVSPTKEGQVSEQEVLDQFTVGDSSIVTDKPRVQEGERARQVMADLFREMFEKSTGADLTDVSDAEIVDCFSYTIFPNTFILPGISLPLIYRFRPHPTDHRTCLYEIMYLRPKPSDGTPYAAAEPVQLRADQAFGEAEGMDKGFARIIDQDTDNLALQQEGLEATAKPGLTLANYQEIRVRHFEIAVDRYMALPANIPGQAKMPRR